MATSSSNPKLTKFKLRYRKAEQDYRLANQRKVAAWTDYRVAMKAAGFCPNCEKELVDCKCQLLGMTS